MELPPFAYNRLLPHPDLSISRLLSFNLPQQLDNSLFGIDQVNIQDLMLALAYRLLVGTPLKGVPLMDGYHT
jgi:hypothetical protein